MNQYRVFEDQKDDKVRVKVHSAIDMEGEISMINTVYG